MGIDYKNYHRDYQYRDNLELFKNIFLKRKVIINKFIKSPGRVLDIGCSNGLFLSLFETSEKWGVEPSENSTRLVDNNIKITRDLFENAKIPNNYFDLVIMNHTLEHVKDAGTVLVKINKVLKKGGYLFIDVPNAGGMGAKILGKYWPYRLPSEHTYQFTKDSLTKIVKDSGFEILLFKSRSGIFECSNPISEIVQSLFKFKKRFFTNIIFLPYYLVATILNMGDSMSFVCIKK